MMTDAWLFSDTRRHWAYRARAPSAHVHPVRTPTKSTPILNPLQHNATMSVEAAIEDRATVDTGEQLSYSKAAKKHNVWRSTLT